MSKEARTCDAMKGFSNRNYYAPSNCVWCSTDLAATHLKSRIFDPTCDVKDKSITMERALEIAFRGCYYDCEPRGRQGFAGEQLSATPVLWIYRTNFGKISIA